MHRVSAALAAAVLVCAPIGAREIHPADSDSAAQLRALHQKVELLLKQNQLLLKMLQAGGTAGTGDSAAPDAPLSSGALAEVLEQIRELQDRLDRIYAQLTLNRTNVTVVTASGTPAPMQPAPGVEYVQDEDQYVHVRVKDAHQEWEVRVDPTYADLNLVLIRSTDATVGHDPARERRALEELAAFVKDQLKVGRKGTREEVIKPGVLEDLHRAQKLFYARRYSEALASVQQSLSVQKTALGYALEGSIHFTLGDTEAAVASWEHALDINPEMEEVRAMLALVRRTAPGQPVPAPQPPKR